MRVREGWEMETNKAMKELELYPASYEQGKVMMQLAHPLIVTEERNEAWH